MKELKQDLNIFCELKDCLYYESKVTKEALSFWLYKTNDKFYHMTNFDYNINHVNLHTSNFTSAYNKAYLVLRSTILKKKVS